MDKPTATLHVFRAGRHIAADGTPHTFSEQDVADLVDSYDPTLHQAPLVVGHPKTNDPAYGWAASLHRVGGEVYAQPANVEPTFAEMVNAKRFPNISVSIYPPNDPANPKPGHFYLRHIGFLGAQPPAVKGLRQAEFAEDSAAIEFSMPMASRISSVGYYLKRLFQGLRDRAIETDGAEKAEQTIPQWAIDGIAEATARDDNESQASAFAEAITTEQTMTQQHTDFAEQERQLETRRTEIEQREQALKDREDAARREDAVEFAENLVKAGKLLPRHQAGIVELLLAFPAGAVLNFAEEGATDATDHDAGATLRTFLEELPPQVNFAEKSGGGTQVNGAIDFALPEGTQVDANRLALHGKALAYQQQHPGTDYIAAVKAVGG